MSAGPVLIMAGGTGGHIFPGIAVARALLARGERVLWLGSLGGLESRIVPAAGLPFEGVAIGGVRGKGWTTRLAAPFRLLRAILAARRVIARARPRSALALGGFASGPGGVACRLAGVPLLVHEQNRVPGLTNRVLAKLARRVLAGFPDAFPVAEHVGNPVRAEIAAIAPPAERFAREAGPLRVLVLGGSQGARALNRAVPAALATLAADTKLVVRHQTGAKLHEEAQAEYAKTTLDARVEPFIDDMAAAYAWADVVVCRAGALTLAELCAAGVGSVLVPYPHAVDDHQTRNAAFLVDCGGALLVPESGALADALLGALRGILAAPGKLLAMAEAARAQARPDAAERIAGLCLAEACA